MAPVRAPIVSALFVGLVVQTLACVKKDPSQAADAEPLPPAPPPLVVDATTGKTTRSRDAGLTPLADQEKTKLLAELKAGRAFAKAEKWAEARASLERALALDPGNSTVLSELSWVFVNMAEWQGVIDTGELALRAAGDARTRAQIFYNMGRAYEGKNDLMEAVVKYRASLERRPNAVVQKHLDELLAKVKRDMVPEVAKKPAPAPHCPRRFLEELALFQCLEGVRDDAFLKTPLVAANEPANAMVPPFRIVRFGNEDAGMVSYLLVRKTSSDSLEPVVELARAWNPGAFGVNEKYTYTSAKETVFGKRHVVEVHGRHSHTDADYGGLSVLAVAIEQVTLCGYEGDEVATCTPPLALAVSETQAYPVDPKGLSAEDRSLLAVLRKEKPPSSVSARAELSLTVDEATVTATSGPKELLPSLGKRPLK